MTEPFAGLPEPTGPTQITVCPDGPLLIRGPVQILDSAGNVVPRNRSTIALCRCGKSRISPFCDGTHKLTAGRGSLNRGIAAEPTDDVPGAVPV